MMKKVERILIYICIVMSLVFTLSFTGSAAAQNDKIKVDSVSVKNVAEGILIKWSKCENAQSFNVYRKTVKGKYARIGTVNKPQRSFTDKKAVAGKKYIYKITPYSKSFKSQGTASAEIFRVAVPEITKIKNTNSGVKITWAKSAGAEKYNIYRKEENSNKWTKLKTVKNTYAYTDTSAENSKVYIYWVRAKIGENVSAPSEKKILHLSAPEISSLKNRADSIEIKWSAVKGAKEYEILRKEPGGKWKKLTSVKSDVRKYNDLSVKENVRYGYAVRVKNPDGVSGFFTNKAYTFLSSPNLSSAKNYADGVLLKWKKVSSADGYVIYRSVYPSDSKKKIATISDKNTVSYKDKTAVSGKRYVYYLAQYKGNSRSAAEPKGKARTFVGAPENLIAKNKDKRLQLTWSKVSGATNYDIYRKTGSNGEWAKLAALGDKNSYTDKTAKTDKIYYYRIKASISNKYFGAYSASVRSSKVDPSKKMIALTYDDGPSSTSTNRILDVLEKYDARATFFVIGSRIPSYYKSLQRADKLGCEIGNHTYSHINLPSYSNSAILNEVNKTNALIKKYTGKTPVIIRAPGGSTNQRVRDCVDMPFIYWSIDTRDWEHRNASKTVASVKNGARDGAIVLMHDIHMPTAAASEIIIPWLIKQGYQLVTVSELMEYRGIKMRSGTTYYNAY